MRLRFAVLNKLLGAAALVASAGCAGEAATPRDARVAPASLDFRDVFVRDVAGQSLTLRLAIASRPALVSLWAPWCEPCRKEQPALERLARAAQACGGLVVAVGVGETPQSVATFARERGLSFRQLADERFELADALGQRRIPTTVVLDRTARVVFTGEALDARAEAALGASLNGEPGQASPCPLR